MPHTTPDNSAARIRKRKTDETTPQKSLPKVSASLHHCNCSPSRSPQAARITNWFSRQNSTSSLRHSSSSDIDSSVKTFDAFVQTDDDASRAVIAGIFPRTPSHACAATLLPASASDSAPALKKAADDAEIARKAAEEAGARQLQVCCHLHCVRFRSQCGCRSLETRNDRGERLWSRATRRNSVGTALCTAVYVLIMTRLLQLPNRAAGTHTPRVRSPGSVLKNDMCNSGASLWRCVYIY